MARDEEAEVLRTRLLTEEEMVGITMPGPDYTQQINSRLVESMAKRNPVDYRYDILDPEFEKCMAMIAHYGAEKYGDYNWHNSRLTGEKSPINHIREHLRKYNKKEPYERFDEHYKWHLVAIAFNAMMEFYYASNFDEPAKP